MFKTTPRIAAAALGSLMASLVVALLAYDVIAFGPVRATIGAALLQADPDERDPPNTISRLVLLSLPGSSLPWQASKISANRFYAGSGAHWTSGKTMLWYLSLRLHTTEKEQIATLAALAYCGHGDYGFSKAAHSLFAKPIRNLDPAESATVVGLLLSPSTLRDSPERLALRRDYLLSRLNQEP